MQTIQWKCSVAGMLDWHKQADEDAVSKALENNLTEVFRTKTNDDCSLVLLTANSRGNDRHDIVP